MHHCLGGKSPRVPRISGFSYQCAPDVCFIPKKGALLSFITNGSSGLFRGATACYVIFKTTEATFVDAVGDLPLPLGSYR